MISSTYPKILTEETRQRLKRETLEHVNKKRETFQLWWRSEGAEMATKAVVDAAKRGENKVSFMSPSLVSMYWIFMHPYLTYFYFPSMEETVEMCIGEIKKNSNYNVSPIYGEDGQDAVGFEITW